jgi:hypothetical protein
MRYPTKWDIRKSVNKDQVFTIHWHKYPADRYSTYTFTDPKDKVAYRLFERYYMGELASIDIELKIV